MEIIKHLKNTASRQIVGVILISCWATFTITIFSDLCRLLNYLLCEMKKHCEYVNRDIQWNMLEKDRKQYRVFLYHGMNATFTLLSSCDRAPCITSVQHNYWQDSDFKIQYKLQNSTDYPQDRSSYPQLSSGHEVFYVTAHSKF